jgi:hypothetical protein
MNNICHICGRDIVSPVDPVCECANELAALRESEITKPCTWAEDSDGVWNAACPPVGEHSFCFTDEGPTENGFKFCCYCGKPIVVIPFDAND